MSLISNPGQVYQITCHEVLRFEQVTSLRSEILVIEFYTSPGLSSNGIYVLEWLVEEENLRAVEQGCSQRNLIHPLTWRIAADVNTAISFFQDLSIFCHAFSYL